MLKLTDAYPYSKWHRYFSKHLIANAAINEEYAKELADSLVRMVKTFSEDESPGKEIGTGICNYLVGV
jgi:hypothetical protein